MMSTVNAPAEPQDSRPVGPAVERSFGRTANWTVGIASAILVFTSVGGYFYHREQLSEIAAEHLRLIVTGPSTIQAGLATEYTVSTKSISGRPLPTQIEVDILDADGRRLKAFKEPVDERGLLQVVVPGDMRLPDRVTMAVIATHHMSREEAKLEIRVAHDRPSAASLCAAWQSGATNAAPQPATTSASAQVTFQPEGGTLAPRLENRVYFAAHDAKGRPLSLSGAVFAKSRSDKAKEEEVVTIQTSYEGLGMFSLTPYPDEAYRLKITTPRDIKSDPTLPQVSTNAEAVLSTGAGVFSSGKPLEFNVRTSKPGMPMVAAAYRYGVQVGQQPFVSRGGPTGANPVAIALDDSVVGVLRLAVYDFSVSPPTRVAERLVYRRPKQSLLVEIDKGKNSYRPGETVSWKISVTDEKRKPAPAAVAVLVVDAAKADTAESAATYALLTSRLAAPVARPDFLLSKKTKENVSAAVALDLTLGNHTRYLDAISPPLMFDNLGQIRSNYIQSMAAYQAGRTWVLNTLTTASFYGGLGLLLLVAMLGLMRIVTGMHLWVPTVGATTCCLIVGAILLDPSRLVTNQDEAIAFKPYCTAPKVEEKPSSSTPTTKKDAPADQRILTIAPNGQATVPFILPTTPATLQVRIDVVGNDRVGEAQAEIVMPAKK